MLKSHVVFLSVDQNFSHNHNQQYIFNSTVLHIRQLSKYKHTSQKSSTRFKKMKTGVRDTSMLPTWSKPRMRQIHFRTTKLGNRSDQTSVLMSQAHKEQNGIAHFHSQHNHRINNGRETATALTSLLDSSKLRAVSQSVSEWVLTSLVIASAALFAEANRHEGGALALCPQVAPVSGNVRPTRPRRVIRDERGSGPNASKLVLDEYSFANFFTIRLVFRFSVRHFIVNFARTFDRSFFGRQPEGHKRIIFVHRHRCVKPKKKNQKWAITF